MNGMLLLRLENSILTFFGICIRFPSSVPLVYDDNLHFLYCYCFIGHDIYCDFVTAYSVLVVPSVLEPYCPIKLVVLRPLKKSKHLYIKISQIG